MNYSKKFVQLLRSRLFKNQKKILINKILKGIKNKQSKNQKIIKLLRNYYHLYDSNLISQDLSKILLQIKFHRPTINITHELGLFV